MADRHRRQGQRRRRRRRQADRRRVGYVEQAYALQNNFTYAAVKNKAGKYVAPTLASTTAAGDGVDGPGRPRLHGHQRAGRRSAYPITSQTFIVVNKDLCKAGMPSAKAKGVQAFLDYGLGARPERRAKSCTTRRCRRRSWRRPRPQVDRAAVQRSAARLSAWKPDRSPPARRPLGPRAVAARARCRTRSSARLLTGARGADPRADRLLLRPPRRRGAAAPSRSTASSASPSTTTGTSRADTSARCRCSSGRSITSALALLIGVPGRGRHRALRHRAVPAARCAAR